jgi:hypothetical protein
MKYILITNQFRRQIKKFRRYLKEQDIVDDVKRFIQRGLTKGEAYLRVYTVLTINMEVVKLRVCVYQVNFRYLIGIINEREYLPIIIDLKKGRYGGNLGFKADKKTVKAIESAVVNMISEYQQHTEEHPTLTAYYVEDE